jgi:hypothetical protein
MVPTTALYQVIFALNVYAVKISQCLMSYLSMAYVQALVYILTLRMYVNQSYMMPTSNGTAAKAVLTGLSNVAKHLVSLSRLQR